MNHQVDNKPKIIVIAGPTASGKTGVSIELAKRFNGEVISADSRQVYRGMDIGTAKVTKEEMQGIPHHLLSVADPKDTYTAADFKHDATLAINDVIERGKLPVLAGGTFFYVDVLLGRVNMPEVPPNEPLRNELAEKSAAQLFTILKSLDPKRAEKIDKDNPRRLLRAIEIATALGEVPNATVVETPYHDLTIGLQVDMSKHADTLRQRVLQRLDTGMIEEVEKLLQSGVSHERLEDFGLEYRYISRYLRHLIDKDTLVEEITNKSRQYAKRQLTWLKRDPDIHWFTKDDPALFDLVEKFLSD